MMVLRVAINGFGRIGRNALRALYESGKRQDIEVVAISDLGSAETNAHLMTFDTTHGRFKGDVSARDDNALLFGRLPLAASIAAA